MPIGLVLLFIAIPFIDLILIILLGQALGLWPTVLLIAGTAVLGGLLIHQQGLAVMRRLFDPKGPGPLALRPAVDSVLMLVAGALLIAPGVLADIAGVVLLVPPLRHGLGRWLLLRFAGGWRMPYDIFRTHSNDAPTSNPAGERQPEPTSGDGPIIEGDYERIDDEDDPNRRTGRRR